MIICKECGNHNEGDDAFCGSCGAFLEWAGEQVVEPEPVAVLVEAVPEPGRVGLVERVKATLRLDTDEDGSPADGGAPADAPPTAAPTDGDRDGAGDAVAAPLAAGSGIEAPSSAGPDDDRPRHVDAAVETPPPPPLPPSPSPAPGVSETGARPPVPPQAAPPPPQAPPSPRPPARPAASAPRPPAATPRPPASTPRTVPAAATPSRSAPDVEPAAAGATGPTAPLGFRPTEVQARRRPVVAPPQKPTIRPGDLVCGQCGEGNDPSRRFCRRCGTTLAESVVAKVPWWRRLVPQRSKATSPAGTRPGRGGPGGGGRRGKGLRIGLSRAKSLRTKVFKVLLVLSMVGFVAGFVGPFKDPIRDLFQSGGDKLRGVVGEPEPVRPTGAAASTQLPGREAGRLIDQVRNTSWAEGAAGFGEGTVIEIQFGAPANISNVGITSGASESPDAFVAQPRPRDVVVVFSDNTSRTLRLDDTPDFQSFDVSAKDVTTARLEIRSVYGGTGGDATAIAELEFFGRN